MFGHELNGAETLSNLIADLRDDPSQEHILQLLLSTREFLDSTPKELQEKRASTFNTADIDDILNSIASAISRFCHGINAPGEHLIERRKLAACMAMIDCRLRTLRNCDDVIAAHYDAQPNALKPHIEAYEQSLAAKKTPPNSPSKGAPQTPPCFSPRQ